MPRVLVIGYGNPLRSDDGLGGEAVLILEEQLTDQSAVELMSLHQLTVELAVDLSEVELAVFIDASEADPPGVIREQDIAMDPSVDIASTHDFSPDTLLTYSQTLYGKHPRAVLVSMGGANFDYGMDLSPLVREAMPELIRRVLKLIQPYV